MEVTMAHFASRLLTAVATVALLAAVPAGDGQLGKAVGISSASAQQMGTSPYNHPARNRSFAAQMQMQQKMLNGANSGASAGGLGALNQWVTNYNSSSTSVGNLNDITMILGDGSSGSVNQNAHQDSTGSQSSSASTTVDIQTEITEILNQNESNGDQQ
jgi:hypothetical protein